jgi:DNA-binding NarL/FixJ family response regulator
VHSYRVILADDHVLFRQGIKRLLGDLKGVEVIGEAGDGIELLSLLRKQQPQMVILDISMPRLRGLEAAKEIKTSFPQIKILILSMHKNTEYFYNAISSGAEGYLLKEDADRELYTAIEKIRRGERYVSPILLADLSKDVVELRGGHRRTSSEDLSIREKEILKLVAEGKTSPEIADLLCISVRTVQNHRANIMRKLNIKNTTDLLRYAYRRGYTSLLN